jgi:hypothetical protein
MVYALDIFMLIKLTRNVASVNTVAGSSWILVVLRQDQKLYMFRRIRSLIRRSAEPLPIVRGLPGQPARRAARTAHRSPQAHLDPFQMHHADRSRIESNQD